MSVSFNEARLIVIMGTCGCGKTTVAHTLADRLNALFIEGDDFHPSQNKAKMSSGVPLCDDDRWPSLSQFAAALSAGKGRAVGSCSALKKAYRQAITKDAGEVVLFVYLHGSKEILAERLASRAGHFMDAGLLESQLQTLEMPDNHEFSITVCIDQSVDDIVGELTEKIDS